jgi:putative ABC transport system permease protein
MVMFNKSLLTDLVRAIRRTLPRFLSITAIIAIGVGFYAGINATSPDMRLTSDKYFDEMNLMDLRLLSPMGFRESDLEMIQGTEGVRDVRESHTKDIFAVSGEDKNTVRLYAYDMGSEASAVSINRVILTEGRYPAASNEVLVEDSPNVPSSFSLGSEVKMEAPSGEDLEDSLREDSYTIVGKIQSPMYIDQARGQTTIGDGNIRFFMLVPKEAFTFERITEVYVTGSGLKEISAYEDEYDEKVSVLKSAFTTLGKERIAQELDELRKKIEDGWAELTDEKKKAYAELDDALISLNDARDQLESGETELKVNDAKYRKQIADGRAQIAAGRKQVSAGWAEYNKNLAKITAAEEELRIPLLLLAESEQLLDAMSLELGPAEDAYDRMLEYINTGEGEIPVVPEIPTEGLDDSQDLSALRELLAQYQADYGDEYESLAEEYGLPPLEELDDPDGIREDIEEINILIRKFNETGELSEEELAILTAFIEENRTRYDEMVRLVSDMTGQIEAANSEIEAGKKQLSAAKSTLEKNDRSLDQAEKTLNASEKTLNAELAAGRVKVDQGWADYREGLAAYEDGIAKANSEFLDAENELRDAEGKLTDIKGEWYVFTRDDNPGYTNFEDDSLRIGNVAKVFPLFFFLVASLVCLTTMTRMVEEERTQIGTLKALGYAKNTISAKYTTYALAASTLGSLIGFAIGFTLFPTIIIEAYKILYLIPSPVTPFHWNYALISYFIATVVTLVAAYSATAKSLRESPSQLMLPKAPPPGKKVLLERIPFIWDKLSFMKKVTIRNLFRYKKRFLMTVIGISGCTALLLTGFGLRDSILSMMGTHFKELQVYDAMVVLDDGSSANEVIDMLETEPSVTEEMYAVTESLTASSDLIGKSHEVTLIAPDDTERLSNYIVLRDRESKSPINLSNDGAVISEKLSMLLGVSPGDRITLENSDKEKFSIKVSGITENYMLHYIYVSKDYYSQVFSREPQQNSILFNLDEVTEEKEAALSEKLLENESVLATVFLSGSILDFTKSLGSFNLVVLVLIIASGALAFVVLFNLTNINITERMREIATIKVLGFRDMEVSTYVFRENIILSFLGSLLGLVLGYLLHIYIIATVELDYIMFGREILWPSYLYAVILTMGFSFIVNFVMYFRLKKINMVESLKSVD